MKTIHHRQQSQETSARFNCVLLRTISHPFVGFVNKIEEFVTRLSDFREAATRLVGRGGREAVARQSRGSSIPLTL